MDKYHLELILESLEDSSNKDDERSYGVDYQRSKYFEKRSKDKENLIDILKNYDW